MSYRKGLDAIVQARRDAFKLSPAIVFCLAAGVIVGNYVSFLAPIFGIAAFGIFYRRLWLATKISCPRCSEPFGTDSKVVFGVGTHCCQNCSLSIHHDK